MKTKQKQETLEEAAERLYPTPTPYVLGMDIGNSMKRDSFIKGAKWQAEQMFKDEAIQTLEKSLKVLLNKTEQMFSREEMINLLEKALTHRPTHELGSLVTAQGEIWGPNFRAWLDQNLK